MNKMLTKLIGNKVLLYVSTRYAVYAMQFVLLIVIASQLGPYNYGIWGFCLMLLGYMRYLNFGIANSIDVLLVQSKNDESESRDYVASAIASVGILACIIVVICIIYTLFKIPLFEKYHIGKLFYILCLISLLFHINNVFGNIYRVYNRLLELSLFQSMVPICLLITVAIFYNNDHLLYFLVGAYLVSHIISFGIFILRGGIPWRGRASIEKIRILLRKGFYLFLYNSCFYLILTTTSNIVSYYYTVEEYGYYTFSYSLGHSVLSLLQAFTYVIFPKVIDKFYSSDLDSIKDVLNSLRINYVSLSHGLMYIAFAVFPLFILFFPKYQDGLYALYITALAILLSTNSFGYNTLLIAQNKEKITAIISAVALCINVIVGISLSYIGVPFYCVIFCVMTSYLVFALLCAIKARKLLGMKSTISDIVISICPLSLFVPYCVAIIIAILHLNYFSWMPFTLFVVMNKQTIIKIYETLKRIIFNPNIIDVKR